MSFSLMFTLMFINSITASSRHQTGRGEGYKMATKVTILLSLKFSVNWSIVSSLSIPWLNFILNLPLASALAAQAPSLQQLLNFKTKTIHINIVEQIGTHYSSLGPFLLIDDTGIRGRIV